uniref:Ectonucleoside triphosphate diphosphohydrolase 2 n=1 Tax=Canis lupus familiaris TaxID=9615 RepID=A0A8C0YXE4_CANLF
MAGKVLSLLPPLLLAAAGLAGLLLLCVPTRDVREPPALKYGIVLDAGSSHTSMFIYKWPADKKNDTGIVGQHSSCEVHGGGISSYADNPSRAGQSLVECLDQALQEVPRERHVGTPLYLGATAGMRLLKLTSPEASANVLAAVTQTLTQYPFDFRGAHILSGQDEGVFGWVTANYLLENFIKYGWVGQWFRPRKGTLGAMDLGGASTQITFEMAGPAEDPTNEVQLRLYGQHYRVYTHSFLCYGRDQVLLRLLAGALQTYGFHPCWPRGYSSQVLLQDVYESPCTVAQRPQTFTGSTRVNLSGTSDPALCRGLILELFNFSSCHFSQCSFNGIFQPPVAGNFIGFSAFFYTVDFLRTVMGLPVETLQQLEVAVVTICNQTWSELQAMRQLAPPCPVWGVSVGSGVSEGRLHLLLQPGTSLGHQTSQGRTRLLGRASPCRPQTHGFNPQPEIPQAPETGLLEFTSSMTTISALCDVGFHVRFHLVPPISNVPA